MNSGGEETREMAREVQLNPLEPRKNTKDKVVQHRCWLLLSLSAEQTKRKEKFSSRISLINLMLNSCL
jgi:hypothetical protein